MTIDIKQLESLLERVTPGEWVIIPACEYDGDDEELEGCYTSPAGIEGGNGDPVCVFGTAEGSGHLFENEADYSLIALAPSLARRVIAAEKLVNAIRDYWLKPDVQNAGEIEAILSEWGDIGH